MNRIVHRLRSAESLEQALEDLAEFARAAFAEERDLVVDLEVDSEDGSGPARADLWIECPECRTPRECRHPNRCTLNGSRPNRSAA